MANPTIVVDYIANTAKLSASAKELAATQSTVARGFKKAFVPAAAALGAISVAAKKAVDNASALNEQTSASGQVFKSNAKEIQAWAKTGATSFGLSATESLKAANAYGNMFNTVGVGTKKSAEMSRAMVQLAGDMASFHDQDPSDMLDRLRAGLAGEAEPLRRFGVLLSQAAIQAEAVSSGLVKTTVDTAKVRQQQLQLTAAQQAAGKVLKEHGRTSLEYQQALAGIDVKEQQLRKTMAGKVPELTAQQKTLASYALIMKQTSSAQGDFARTADSVANRQRTLNAQMENTSATFGQVLLPVTQALLGVFSKLSGVMQNHATAVQVVVGAVAALAGFVIAVNGALKLYGAATAVASAATWLFSESSTAAGKSSRAAAIATKLQAAATWLLNAALAANPIVLVIAALVALGVALAVLWTKSETFRRIVTAGWEAIKSAAQAVFGWLKANWPLLLAILTGPIGLAVAMIIRHWTTIKNTVTGAVAAIKSAISSGFNALVGIVTSAGTRMIAAFTGALRAGVAAVRTAVTAILQAVKGAFAGAASLLFEAGAQLIAGFVSGILSKVGAVADAAGKVVGAAKGAVKTVAGLFSPSRVFFELGSDTAQGYVDGLAASVPKAERAAALLALRAIEAARGPLQQASGQLGEMLANAFQAKQAAAKTPAELALERMQMARDQAQRQQALVEAQEQLRTAQTAEETLAAQRALEQAKFDIRAAALQKRAAQERFELDSRQQANKAAFDKGLASLQEYLNSANVTAEGARKRITAFMNRFGIEMSDMGALVGKSLAAGMRASKSEVEAAAAELAAAVSNAAKAKLKIRSPSRVMQDEVGAQIAAGIAQGMLQNAGAVTGALTALTPNIGIESGAGLGSTHVRVFIGDRELTDIVRAEVASGDTGLARSLLAGAVA